MAVDHFGAVLDRFALAHPDHQNGVAAVGSSDRGVPREMWTGDVDAEGWVTWRMLPSTVQVADIERLGRELGARFPVHLQAYLMARAHCFGQSLSDRFGECLSLPDTPSRNPLRRFRNTYDSWAFLYTAGYLPVGTWGDGWGPICLDLAEDHPEEDAPVVWFDHESLVDSAGTATWDRGALKPLAQPLFESFTSCVEDAFHE